jgi:hypothetical protein
MICRHCNASFPDSESYIAHLESLQDVASITTPEERTAYTDGIQAVLARNNNDPSRRIERPCDFGILGQD